MALPTALWWKFSLPTGAHLLRARGCGAPGQEVLLDGVPLDAPAGTLQFTGPSGALLELREEAGGWLLLVDGERAESYMPGLAPAPQEDQAWFRFKAAGGTHRLRCRCFGSPQQELVLDGVPLEAPPGTAEFTGPGGVLLELQYRNGRPALLVDGALVPPEGPEPTGPALCWDMALPGGGSAELRVEGPGGPGQRVLLAGELLPAPPGQLSFTGPGGCLLELREEAGRWALLRDGAAVEPSAAWEGAWAFAGPAGEHELRLAPGGELLLDGQPVAGPAGQRQLTGPGGCLLELVPEGGRWRLLVEGKPAAAMQAPQAVPQALPQGVSHAASGAYVASLRVGGRFRQLGEFATPQAAHARYLEAKAELGAQG